MIVKNFFIVDVIPIYFALCAKIGDRLQCHNLRDLSMMLLILKIRHYRKHNRVQTAVFLCYSSVYVSPKAGLFLALSHVVGVELVIEYHFYLLFFSQDSLIDPKNADRVKPS